MNHLTPGAFTILETRMMILSNNLLMNLTGIELFSNKHVKRKALTFKALQDAEVLHVSLVPNFNSQQSFCLQLYLVKTVGVLVH